MELYRAMWVMRVAAGVQMETPGATGRHTRLLSWNEFAATVQARHHGWDAHGQVSAAALLSPQGARLEPFA